VVSHGSSLDAFFRVLIDPSEAVFVYSPVSRALVRPHHHARPRTSNTHLRQLSPASSLNPTTRALKEISSLSRHHSSSSTIPSTRISFTTLFCSFNCPLCLIVSRFLPPFCCPPSPPSPPPQPSLIPPSPFSIRIQHPRIPFTGPSSPPCCPSQADRRCER
jgi:hypothetical protein